LGIFSSSNDMTQIKLFKKIRGVREMPMKKIKSFIYFEMLEEGYKFERLFFSCFQVKNKVADMYKIYYLYQLKRFIQKIKLVVTYAFIE